MKKGVRYTSTAVDPSRPIISKAEVVILGLSRYFTGNPCKNGHIAERNTSRGDCLECLYQRQRKWNLAHTDETNERSRAWYGANKFRATLVRSEWRRRNQDKVKADVAAYQAANKERLSVAAKIWARDNKQRMKLWRDDYRAKNTDYIRAQASAWARRNPDKITAKKTKRIASKLRATPAWANHAAIRAVYAEASRLSRETGIKHHVDHIYPLRSSWCCGLHVESNLQILTAHENQTKSNRRPTGASAPRECVY